LHDDGAAITAQNINALLNAANVKVTAYLPTLYAKLFGSKNIDDLILGGSAPAPVPTAASAASAGSAAPAAAAAPEEKKKEEKKEEEEEEVELFGLFD
jgi:ribosomal protein L12E/L44/L45/RPP1/RPP2